MSSWGGGRVSQSPTVETSRFLKTKLTAITLSPSLFQRELPEYHRGRSPTDQKGAGGSTMVGLVLELTPGNPTPRT